MKNLEHPLVQKAVKVEKGFNINQADANGTKMSTYTSSTKPKKNKSGEVIATNKGTHASHDVYSDAQDEIMRKFHEKAENYTQEQAIKFLNCLSKKTDDAIKLHCPKGGRKVDELFKHEKFKQTGIIDKNDFFE